MDKKRRIAILAEKTINGKELYAQAEALLNWFESQEIPPSESIAVMGIVVSLVLAALPEKMCGEYRTKFDRAMTVTIDECHKL